MAFLVKATLDRFGIRRVAEASGIPFWTLRKWYDQGRIPGATGSVAQAMRRKTLIDAIAYLEPLKKPAKKKTA